MHVDLRHLVDAQHAVVVEVRLQHPSFCNDDLAVKRGREAEDQPALQLRHDRIGIDRDAGIDGRSDTAQMNLAKFIDLGFDDGCNKAAERRLHAHAAPDAPRQRLTPIGFLRHQIEGCFEPRISAEHGAAELDGILARLARQFVNEAFGSEDVVVRTDAAPEAGDNAQRLGAHVSHLQVRNIVRHVDGAIDRVDIDAVLESRRQPARHDRRARNLIFPGDDLAVL